MPGKWPVTEVKPKADAYVRELLCFVRPTVDYAPWGELLNYFPGYFTHKYLKVHQQLKLFLVYSDTLFRLSLNGKLFINNASSLLTPFLNALIAMLGSSNVHQDKRELWILKILDFMFGSMAILRTPPRSLKSEELTEILWMYCRSIHRVVRT